MTFNSPFCFFCFDFSFFQNKISALDELLYKSAILSHSWIVTRNCINLIKDLRFWILISILTTEAIFLKLMITTEAIILKVMTIRTRGLRFLNSFWFNSCCFPTGVLSIVLGLDYIYYTWSDFGDVCNSVLIYSSSFSNPPKILPGKKTYLPVSDPSDANTSGRLLWTLCMVESSWPITCCV